MTEWLEADGLGGFAMGAADGIRTRRYHAILLAATAPPDRRMVLVADLEVFVETAAGRFALSSHRYRDDVIYPDGATRIATFTHVPWPRWEWVLPDETRIACELVVEPGAPRVALRWTRVAGSAGWLHVQPLLAPRDFHALHHENPDLHFEPELEGDRVIWRPYPGVPAITALANAVYQHAPDWYRSVDYLVEAERGLDHVEDLATPGVFTFDLSEGHAALVFAAGDLHGNAAEVCEKMFTREARRRAGFTSPLARAGDAYLVAKGQGRTVIAGYPWFGDWGRDTFISLRGLCLATGRRAEAAAILTEWAIAGDHGMLPNRFADHDASPEYNSVDAALWYVIAAGEYLAGATAGAPERAPIEAAIAAIVDGYAAGTRHAIHADDDGLLACGVDGLQLTWMDARVDGQVVTPRVGKPVEIQALWINALAIAGRSALADQARSSFRARFWDARNRQLYDVIDTDHVPGAVDATCRPNQLFAIGGLPEQLVDGDRARAVVDMAERVLWTPAGPRSLAATDPRYHPHYVGGPAERDRGYHCGAVWPWLAGAFVEAWVRVRGSTAEAKREARRRFLDPLLARLELAGLGHLPEINDGDPPHRAVGCPFQAWSVAEALRLDLVVLA